MEKLLSGDCAPRAGLYTLIAPNGTAVFTIRLKKGDRLPVSDVENGQFVYEG